MRSEYLRYLALFLLGNVCNNQFYKRFFQILTFPKLRHPEPPLRAGGENRRGYNRLYWLVPPAAAAAPEDGVTNEGRRAEFPAYARRRRRPAAPTGPLSRVKFLCNRA